MIEDVTGPDDRFIVRAEADAVAGAKGLHGFNHAVRLVRLLTRRPEGWTVTVRRAAEDPSGEPLLYRRVDDQSAVEQEVVDIASDIRAGSLFTG